MHRFNGVLPWQSTYTPVFIAQKTSICLSVPLEFSLSKQWQKRYKQKQKETTKVTFLKKKKQEDIVQS